jgi:hypothetical protein
LSGDRGQRETKNSPPNGRERAKKGISGKEKPLLTIREGVVF